MSHQVIITFDLDENRVQENAEQEAGRQIAKTIMDKLFGKPEYISYRDAKVRNYATEIMKQLLEPYKDEIIEQTVHSLVESLKRTKIVKDKLSEALSDGEQGS
jgi:phosphotransacetylase